MRRAARGFTLIEVLVALAIVAIGMAAVLSTLTSSASTILYMKDKTLANWLALNLIAEQRLKPQIAQLGNTDGDVDYAGQKWHWRQETVATAVQGMVRMDMMVKPADSKTDDDRGWYVTLSGIMGDAVAAPRGDMPLWGSGNMMPTPGQNGINGQPGSSTGLGNSNGPGNGLSRPTTSPAPPTNPPPTQQ